MTTRSRGFTLISAIFLMVVLALLSASLVTLSSVQHTTAAQQLQGVRAMYAARLGAEWALAQAGTPGGCPAGPTALTPGGALSGFNVSVRCARTLHTLPGGTQEYYVVDVAASSGAYGSTDFVSRRLQAKVLGPIP